MKNIKKTRKDKETATDIINALPEIVAEGKKEVQRILERLESPHKLTLQTNE